MTKRTKNDAHQKIARKEIVERLKKIAGDTSGLHPNSVLGQLAALIRELEAL